MKDKCKDCKKLKMFERIRNTHVKFIAEQDALIHALKDKIRAMDSAIRKALEV